MRVCYVTDRRHQQFRRRLRRRIVPGLLEYGRQRTGRHRAQLQRGALPERRDRRILGTRRRTRGRHTAVPGTGRLRVHAVRDRVVDTAVHAHVHPRRVAADRRVAARAAVRTAVRAGILRRRHRRHRRDRWRRRDRRRRRDRSGRYKMRRH